MTISTTTNPLYIIGIMLIVSFLLVGVVLIDDAFAQAWIRAYFRQGIPLYRKHFYLKENVDRLELFAKPLEEHLKQRHQDPPVLFRAISVQELAFYQKELKGEKRSPLITMHGVVLSNPHDQKLSLTGYMSYTNVSVLLLLSVIAFWILKSMLGDFSFSSGNIVLIFMVVSFLFRGFVKKIMARRELYLDVEEAIQFVFQEYIGSREQLAELDGKKNKQTGFSGIELVLIIVLAGLLALLAAALLFLFN